MILKKNYMTNKTKEQNNVTEQSFRYDNEISRVKNILKIGTPFR
jgi:membrane-associated HD superfamily phosphohydrolase